MWEAGGTQMPVLPGLGTQPCPDREACRFQDSSSYPPPSSIAGQKEPAFLSHPFPTPGPAAQERPGGNPAA